MFFPTISRIIRPITRIPSPCSCLSTLYLERDMTSPKRLPKRFLIPLCALTVACFSSNGFSQDCYISDSKDSCPNQKGAVNVWQATGAPGGHMGNYKCTRDFLQDAICAGGGRKYDVNIRQARGQQQGRSKKEPCGRWTDDYYTCDGQKFPKVVLQYGKGDPCGKLDELSGNTCVEQ